MSQEWDDLRKIARKLENEVDVKLVALSKISSSSGTSNYDSSSDQAPLLNSDHVFETISIEIEKMLQKLSEYNEKMMNLENNNGTTSKHTIARHAEILHGYKQEFAKIQTNHTIKLEREELLKGSGLSLGIGSASGLSRRDMYLKESQHVANSHNMINDQISIAVETKEHLLSQRASFKRLQTRFNDLSNRFPVISSLLQRINIKKRRDTLILGLVIAGCTILMLLYALH